MKPVIQKIEFGNVIINGKRYGCDILITPDDVRETEKTHKLDTHILEDAILGEPEIVIIGIGFNGLVNVPDEVKTMIKNAGADLVIKKTPEALKDFQALLKQGKKVVAWIHTTC
ncbi:MAG: hypothetical protein J7K31_03355 [Candidatus Aenigmarchaeota archaeon]|nr:hypothetical protein [Candidatus Aenigmarchaeota archaeon]